METRRPFSQKSPKEIHSLADFINQTTGDSLSREQTLKVLTHLIRSDEHVYDVWDEGRRTGVAVLVDTCDNLHNSAELSLFGEFSQPGYDQWIHWAESLLEGSAKSALELPEWIEQSFPSAWLANHRFDPSYRIFRMERSDKPAEKTTPLPPSLRWVNYSETYLPSYLDTVRLSLGTLPGAFVPDVDIFRNLIEDCPFPPQLLVEGNDRVVGFVRCSRRETTGEIAALGRHPQFRGQGLGLSLLQRGLEQLEDAGLKTVCLEVVTSNEKALELYRKFGFLVAHQMAVYIKRLRQTD